MAFLFEFIVEALEWRWAFRIAALFSFLVALVLMVSVLEPRRKAPSVSSGGDGRVWCGVVWCGVVWCGVCPWGGGEAEGVYIYIYIVERLREIVSQR